MLFAQATFPEVISCYRNMLSNWCFVRIIAEHEILVYYCKHIFAVPENHTSQICQLTISVYSKHDVKSVTS